MLGNVRLSSLLLLVVMVVLVLVCCGNKAVVEAAGPGEYTDRYDNVNVDRILQNGRILGSYIKCMLDEGACTAEGRELKKNIPDALLTGCKKCNQKQKEIAEKVINHIMAKRPADWDRLLKKYDQKGEFKKRFEAHNKKFPF